MEMSWPFMTHLLVKWQHVNSRDNLFLFFSFLTSRFVYLICFCLSACFQVTSSTRTWSTTWAWGFKSPHPTMSCRRLSGPICIAMLCLVSKDIMILLWWMLESGHLAREWCLEPLFSIISSSLPPWPTFLWLLSHLFHPLLISFVPFCSPINHSVTLCFPFII